MAESKTIHERFAEAWSKVENPEMDGMNPHYKNRYATLKSTLGAIRAACAPLGIAYVQRLRICEDGNYRLCSSVEDAAGGSIELSTFPVENVPNSQAFGSEMTYKKRQQAQADWAITGEEDEDGEAITASQNERKARNTQKGKTTRPRSNGAAHGQSAASRYDKLKQLKAQALELGITEDGMNAAISNILQGKPMKDATDTELKVCEGCLAGIISDKRELMEQQGRIGDVD